MIEVCAKCGTEVEDCPGIGPICPSFVCDNLDGPTRQITQGGNVMAKIWCEHLTWEQGTNKNDPNCGAYYFQKIDSQRWRLIVMNHDGWKQCPICLTPRPAEEKRLSEKLREASRNYQRKVTSKPDFAYMASGESEAVAQTAYEHVREKVKIFFKDVDPLDFESKLLKLIEESL